MAYNLAAFFREAQLMTSRDLTPLVEPSMACLSAGPAAVSNDLMEEGILWMAAPKRRTSHSKKRMRMANKWLKPIRNYKFCEVCGNPRLWHHLCGHCFKETLKKTAEMRRQMQQQQQQANTELDLATKLPSDEELVENTSP